VKSTAGGGDTNRKILDPFDNRESCSIADAAEQIGRCRSTTRNLSAHEGLGRRIGGRVVVSRPALSMFLSGDPRDVGQRTRCLGTGGVKVFKVETMLIPDEGAVVARVEEIARHPIRIAERPSGLIYMG